MQKKRSADENKEQIGNLLAKYKTILKPPQATVEKEFIESVKECTGFTITKDNVSYTVGSKTIHLKVSSVLKTELKKHQIDILNDLKSRLPAASLPTSIV